MTVEFIEDVELNAAFQDDNCYAEFARIFRDLADKIEAGFRDGIIHDINGNRVGTWAINKS